MHFFLTFLPLFIERRVERGQVITEKKDERNGIRKCSKADTNLHHPQKDYICWSMCANC